MSLVERLLEAEVDGDFTGAPAPRGVRVDGQERLAIAAPVSSRIRFRDLPLLPDSRLEFGFGVDTAAGCDTPGPVRFEARLEAGGTSRSWSGEATVAGVFAAGRLDLASSEMGTGKIVLETRPVESAGCGTALWVQPRLRSSGRSIPLAERPVERLRPHADLLPRLPPGAAEQRVEMGEPLPQGGRLEVAGALAPLAASESAAAAPVTFTVEQAGAILFRRALRASPARVSFQAVVALPPTDTRPAALRFRIEAPPAILAAARWTQATLQRVERAARLPAASGSNLLLLVVDTLRADHLGVYGYTRPTSPNLDRFAEQAVVYETAISQSSWTQPATATLLTGLYPIEHGVLGGVRLDPALETLPESLQGAGFTTFALSANPVIGRGSGFHAGSETFLQAPFARADAVREGFESWLEEQRDRRWFAYLHFMDPHEPYEAPPPFAGTFTRGYDGPLRDPARWAELLERVNFRDESPGITAADLEYLVGAYDEEVRSWDEAFGRLLATLARRDLLERTIVVVTSDHGEEFLEHGRLKHGLQLFDETLRVPLLIRAPARLPPGRRAAQVETRALPGTLLALAGVRAGAPWAPHLLELQESDRLPAYSHTTLPALGDGAHRPSLVSIRDSDWKLIRELDRDDAALLFDLATDPGEQHDVAAVDPARANDYRARLRLWLERGAARGAVPLDPDLMERLRALGYVH